MDAQLSAALIALALIIVGSIGAVVKALTDRVLSDLANNTRITRETREASNGRLEGALRELAKERDRVMALRELVRERDDRIAYIRARIPQVDELISDYGRRREDRITRNDESRALRQVLTDLDDPTGFDAGRVRPR